LFAVFINVRSNHGDKLSNFKSLDSFKSTFRALSNGNNSLPFFPHIIENKEGCFTYSVHQKIYSVFDLVMLYAQENQIVIMVCRKIFYYRDRPIFLYFYTTDFFRASKILTATGDRSYPRSPHRRHQIERIGRCGQNESISVCPRLQAVYRDASASVFTIPEDRSKQLLTNTQLSISDISYQLGFASQSHFTATFRRFTTVTPNLYRQELRASF
jgi:Helix-turn-helix domain